jgi:hypothetical protein
VKNTVVTHPFDYGLQDLGVGLEGMLLPHKQSILIIVFIFIYYFFAEKTIAQEAWACYSVCGPIMILNNVPAAGTQQRTNATGRGYCRSGAGHAGNASTALFFLTALC